MAWDVEVTNQDSEPVANVVMWDPDPQNQLVATHAELANAMKPVRQFFDRFGADAWDKRRTAYRTDKKQAAE